MKLTKLNALELENAILKTNLAKSNLQMIRIQYEDLSNEINKLTSVANDLAKKFGGKDYKEGATPNLNIETNELTFKE